MSFGSPFADVDIPDIGVYEYVFGDIADADLNRIALVDAATGCSLQYGELIRRINAFAGALAEREIGVGDVVALLAPNSSAFAIAFHGILRVGATVTTVNTHATANDITEQLRDSGARMLITVTALLVNGEHAAVRAGLSYADVVVLDGSVDSGSDLGCRTMADMLSSGSPVPTPRFDPATHVAVIPYSSGTTGNPKGVLLTHRNVVANLAQLQPLTKSGADEVLLAVMPFFHSYGLTALLNAGLRGRCRLIVMAAFEFDEFLSNIQNHKCTQVFLAPPVLVALAKHSLVDSFDLSSLHTVMSAGGQMDQQIGNAVASRLRCRVVQAYGLTELSPASHVVPFDGGIDLVGTVAPLSSCGWTVPNSESKIIDSATGTEIPIPTAGLSDAGELCFKGPNVMAGYLGNDSATAMMIDADGFLHTGDLARVDAHGCVYIVDRLKELIKYRGFQVPPVELEALLLTHPGIADAAVIGINDRQTGEEIPKAYIVRQPGAQHSEVQVMNYVARRVAPYKKIRQVEFVDAIPKSSMGKILRNELRSRNGHSRQATTAGRALEYERRGQGNGLVLIHGTASTGLRNWGPVLDSLAATHTVVLPNLPGSGKSPLPLGPLQMDAIVDQVAATALEAGLDRFAVAGAALGAPIAIALAARHPERVSALVTVGGFAYPRRTFRMNLQVWAALQGRTDTLLGKFLTTLAFAEHYLATQPTDAVKRLIAQFGADYSAGTAAQIAFTLGVDVRDMLDEVRAPTLVVSPASDRFVSPEHSVELSRGITAAELVHVMGGHAALLEGYGCIERVLLDFLATIRD